MANENENNRDLVIYSSPSNDSRTARGEVSKEELKKSTEMHINDVKLGLRYFAGQLLGAADMHDHTKLEFLDEYYAQFQEAAKTGKWPKGEKWWYEKFHLTERHHLEDRVPEDVNLVDVFEMLVDCVMAGMARTGKYIPENEPSPELLKKAYVNTRDLLLSKVVVKEPPVDNGESNTKFGLDPNLKGEQPNGSQS